MPTVLMLVVALLMDLRLAAQLVGLRVQARLINDGDEAVQAVVGDSCAGPLFKLVVDGKERPFVGTAKACGAPHLYAREVPAHGVYEILSDALDGRRHRVQVKFGKLASPVLEVATDVRVDVKLAATRRVREGEAVEVEVTHVNRSPEGVEVAVCGGDRVLVDGKERELGAECPEGEGKKRWIPVRGAWVTRGKVGGLEVGKHFFRARWGEAQSEDAEVEVVGR